MNNILSSSAAKNILRKIMPPILLLCFVSICFSASFQLRHGRRIFSFPSGLYILKTRDWRMNKEAPPLIKCLPALSSLTTKPKIETQPFQDVPNTWRLGYSFMNLNKDRYQSVFTYGRCIIIILGLLLGLTVYFGAKNFMDTKERFWPSPYMCLIQIFWRIPPW